MKPHSELSEASVDWSEKSSPLFFDTYARQSFVPVRGEGVYLYDEDEKEYLDLVTGLGVNALGHAHPAIVAAVNEQIQRFSHLSNAFINIPQVRLAERVLELSPDHKRIFFTNSGTESIEGALKLVRRWAVKNNRETIYAFSKGFHGRSLGALSLTHKDKYRKGYGPFMPEVAHLQFDSLKDLEKINEKTAAVCIEFVLGEGGIRPISCEFADELDRLHRLHQFLLIADETQSGVGRTGQFFAFQWYTLKPDIVVTAKPIGGGLPLGLILGNHRVETIWGPGDHGTTFGGNPVACAAGLAVVDWLSNGGMAHVAQAGKKFGDALRYLQGRYPAVIKSTRAFGLMAAIELFQSSADYPKKALAEGLIINSTDDTVIRLLPPLIIQDEHIQEMVRKFERIFGK